MHVFLVIEHSHRPSRRSLSVFHGPDAERGLIMDVIRTQGQVLRRKLREVGLVKPFRLKDGDPPAEFGLSRICRKN